MCYSYTTELNIQTGHYKFNVTRTSIVMKFRFASLKWSLSSKTEMFKVLVKIEKMPCSFDPLWYNFTLQFGQNKKLILYKNYFKNVLYLK